MTTFIEAALAGRGAAANATAAPIATSVVNSARREPVPDARWAPCLISGNRRASRLPERRLGATTVVWRRDGRERGTRWTRTVGLRKARSGRMARDEPGVGVAGPPDGIDRDSAV